MRVEVQHSGSSAVMDEDGNFRCAHENVEVEAPCCSGYDSEGLPSCGCHGQYGVYCYDCNNDELEDFEVERILDDYLIGLEPDFD